MFMFLCSFVHDVKVMYAILTYDKDDEDHRGIPRSCNQIQFAKYNFKIHLHNYNDSVRQMGYKLNCEN